MDDSESSSNENQDLRIASVFILLTASALGVFPTILARFSEATLQSLWFSCMKAFGGGVIVTLGFVHLLSDAFEDLSELREFPITTSICLASLLFMFFLEQAAAAYIHYSNPAAVVAATRQDDDHDQSDEGHSHAHHHAHISLKYDPTKSIVVAHLLEFGILVHSVIIGIGLGVTTDGMSLKSLLIALCFHQFFEGIGLGAAIASAKVSFVKGIVFAFLYSITTPIGVGIGIGLPMIRQAAHLIIMVNQGISSTYDAESRKAQWIQGSLNAVAAGIIIYAGLVEMLVEDFTRCERDRPLKKVAMALSVLVGYGLMTLIANWA